MTTILNPEKSEAVRNLLVDVAMRLDSEDFAGFLSHCADDFHYEATADSADLGVEMSWLEHDVQGLREMFAMIPKHVRMRGRITRHLSLSRITKGETDASATTSVMLVHTTETGESKLIASGRYHDTIVFDGAGMALLANRRVALDTITWSPGLHVPI